MGRTLLDPLRALRNQAPIPYVSRTRTIGSLITGRSSGAEAQMRAMGGNGTLFAIVDRVTTSYSQIEWKLWRKAKSGLKSDRVEVTSHAALDLWNSPNPFMTGPAFRETAQQHEELTGEQWWTIAHHPRMNIPLELWPVRPDRMQPVPDPEQFLTGYLYTGPGGEQVPLGTNDVIFLRRPNPLDPYRGMGAVQSILTSLDANRFSKEWNRNFFLNSAEPGGVLQVDKRLSDNEFNEARQRWQEQHRGVANAHRVSILENGLTWVDRKYTNRDMQFVELDTVSRETIREALGFPKPMLGSVDDVNRANADAAEVVFARWLLVPRCERTKAALNTRLLPMYGDTARDLEFDYVNPVPEDLDAEAAQLTAKATAAGLLITAGLDARDVLSAVGLPEMQYRAAPTLSAQRPVARLTRPSLPLAVPVANERPALPAVRVPTRSGDEWHTLVAGLTGQDSAAGELEQVRQDHEAALADLLTDWDGIEATWIADLTVQVQRAVDDDDLAALASLSVDTTHADTVLRTALGAMAQTAADRMADEARAQGVEVTAPTIDAELQARAGAHVWDFGGELVTIASATAALLSGDLSSAAGREALRLFVPGASGNSVASKVANFLRGLKGRLKLDQLGGALHRATNTGRLATLEVAPHAEYEATEILDTNTCDPCAEIDGTIFADLDAARAAYGAGGYHSCDGGIRCRGTITATWGQT